ncbi:MAG TPA: alanine racemase [bacterium]|jgi:diaminopimelate decarboxylase
MAAVKKRYERPTIIKQYSGMMNKIGGRAYGAPVSEIEGVPVSELVERFGSPLFVMSERLIRFNQKRAHRIFRTRYPKVQFAWSYKTNYLDAVCKVIHGEGSWAEVVSEFEYDKARRLGVPGSQILFNGPHKSTGALTKAIDEGAYIHIDHHDELYDLIELTEKIGKTANVAVRVNMDTGIYPMWDRFGLNYENGEAWQVISRIMQAPTLRLAGLHTHIGTYIMASEPYRIAASKLAWLAKNLREQYHHTLDYIDMGGGFASHNTLISQYLPAEGVVPTLEQFADAIASGLADYAPPPPEQPTLFLETGRALIDDAGFLVTTVLANKRLSDGRRAAIIDAGVNILFTSFWYKHTVSPEKDHGAVYEDTALYGPLCMNIDMVREQVTLPPLQKGDKLVLHRVGAYDVTQWMQFITLRPNVVMVMENGSVEVIRRAETLEDLVSKEQIPESLRTA